jgi:hypothetical protein
MKKTIMQTQESEFYKTADLALVAVILLLSPDSLEVLDRTNQRKVLFVFKKTDELVDLVDKYWKRELTVEPQSFFSQLKIAKVRIYADN